MNSSPPTWLSDVIRCPRCKARCGCLHRTTANGAPVLIDFEHSVINEADVVDKEPKPLTLTRRIVRHPWMFLTNGNGGVKAITKAGQLLSKIQAPRVLLVGGGERWQGLEGFLGESPTAEIVNSDVYPAPHVHVLTDAHQLAFNDASFDLVIAQAVFEHLVDPPAAADEIWRVLKPDGLVLADTPFLQAVHMGRYDFTRYTPLGQRALFRRFTEIEVGISAGPMSSLRWAIEHFLRTLFRSPYPAMLLRPMTIPLGWIDQFTSRYAFDACCGSYFIGRKSGHTATPKEIIAGYKGAQ